MADIDVAGVDDNEPSAVCSVSVADTGVVLRHQPSC